MLVQRLRKSMAARPVSNKEQILRRIRLTGGNQACAARIGNGCGRQAVDDIGVPGGRRAQLAPAQAPAQNALPARDAINDGWVGLQTHPGIQAIDEHAGHLAAFVGDTRFLLDDRGKGQQLFRALQRHIRITRLPGRGHPFFLLLQHARDHRVAFIAGGDLIAVRGQGAFGWQLTHLTTQNVDLAQSRRNLPAGHAFGQGNTETGASLIPCGGVFRGQIISGRIEIHHFDKAVGRRIQFTDKGRNPVDADAKDHLGPAGARPAACDLIDDLRHRCAGLQQETAGLQLVRLLLVVRTDAKDRSTRNRALLFKIQAHAAHGRPTVD